MSVRRTGVRWVVCIVAMLPTCSVARTQVARATVEHTGTVALGTLSVKPLGVDLPWDPRVCVGCDRNNGMAIERGNRHRRR